MDECSFERWDNAMIIKGLADEDFVNFKTPCMFIITAKCDFKCETENGIKCCQNSSLVKSPDINVSADEIFHRYINNPITHAIVVGGLEPMLQFDELLELIGKFRSSGCSDPFVIYTGYYPHEIGDQITQLSEQPNIIVKYGRFIPDQPSHIDPILGVKLASDNQYAEQIS